MILPFLVYSGVVGSAQTAPNWTTESHRVYKVRDGAGLILDVLRPTADPNGLGIVVVYSGGWYCTQAVGDAFMKARLYEILCHHGYTVFVVQPGARPRFTGAEMVANLKLSIQWVKQQASEYAVDAERIGLFGASSGGHLALMAAAQVEAGSPESKEPLGRYSSGVAAVMAFFPPTEMRDWNGEPEGYKLLADLFSPCGIGEIEESVAEASADAISPSKHVTPALPPILLIHGSADPLVPLSQSERMVDAVEKVGGDIELIVKYGGGHAWPDLDQEVEVAADWFDEVLGE